MNAELRQSMYQRTPAQTSVHIRFNSRVENFWRRAFIHLERRNANPIQKPEDPLRSCVDMASARGLVPFSRMNSADRRPDPL